MYGIYINLGCRFEFRTQKLPYERISGNFSDFIDFGHQVRVCKKRSFPSISCISKCMGFTQIWVADLNSELKNYPMKEFWAIFSISSILVIRSGYAKKDHFSNISCNSKYMGFTLIWVADLNSERKNYRMKEFRAIFPISSILVIRSGYAKKGHFPVLAVFQNIWDLHEFGLQIWI